MLVKDQELNVNDVEFLKAKGITREKPFNSVLFDKGNYIVKTADSIYELIETFKLRYTVYGAFYSVKPSRPLDVDEFDNFG